MSNPPTISDAEWEVMTVLWDQSPLTANAVVERLKGRKAWNPRTTKTLLNRLVKKKALDFTTQGNRYLYRPRVKREACVRTESRSFIRRIFGGEVGPMLVQFVRQSDLSAAEIEQLKKLLDEKTGEQRS
jgi:BlaI family transcriptional regulator, penicillinase repressor